jgi:hypothetical protein
VDTPKEVVQVIRKALEAYQQSHQLVVEEMPEEQRAGVAGRLMRAAAEQAAIDAPEAVSAATAEATAPAESAAPPDTG